MTTELWPKRQKNFSAVDAGNGVDRRCWNDIVRRCNVKSRV